MSKSKLMSKAARAATRAGSKSSMKLSEVIAKRGGAKAVAEKSTKEATKKLAQKSASKGASKGANLGGKAMVAGGVASAYGILEQFITGGSSAAVAGSQLNKLSQQYRDAQSGGSASGGGGSNAVGDSGRSLEQAIVEDAAELQSLTKLAQFMDQKTKKEGVDLAHVKKQLGITKPVEIEKMGKEPKPRNLDQDFVAHYAGINNAKLLEIEKLLHAQLEIAAEENRTLVNSQKIELAKVESDQERLKTTIAGLTGLKALQGAAENEPEVALDVTPQPTIEEPNEEEEGEYSSGGYTPRGGKYEPAGVVHKGEYVIPSDMVEDPRIQPTIAALESERIAKGHTVRPVSGYAEGGEVEDPESPSESKSSTSFMSTIGEVLKGVMSSFSKGNIMEGLGSFKDGIFDIVKNFIGNKVKNFGKALLNAAMSPVKATYKLAKFTADKLGYGEKFDTGVAMVKQKVAPRSGFSDGGYTGTSTSRPRGGKSSQSAVLASMRKARARAARDLGYILDSASKSAIMRVIDRMISVASNYPELPLGPGDILSISNSVIIGISQGDWRGTLISNLTALAKRFPELSGDISSAIDAICRAKDATGESGFSESVLRELKYAMDHGYVTDSSSDPYRVIMTEYGQNPNSTQNKQITAQLRKLNDLNGKKSSMSPEDYQVGVANALSADTIDITPVNSTGSSESGSGSDSGSSSGSESSGSSSGTINASSGTHSVTTSNQNVHCETPRDSNGTIKPNPGNESFNIDAAVSHLDSKAHSSSTGYCAQYVREAFEAGGLNTGGHPASASSYSTLGFMGKLGFKEINTPPIPFRGDVIVEESTKSHPDGHIQMFDGTQWVSDFKQRSVHVHSSGEGDQRYYRHNSVIKNGVVKDGKLIGVSGSPVPRQSIKVTEEGREEAKKSTERIRTLAPWNVDNSTNTTNETVTNNYIKTNSALNAELK